MRKKMVKEKAKSGEKGWLGRYPWDDKCLMCGKREVDSHYAVCRETEELRKAMWGDVKVEAWRRGMPTPVRWMPTEGGEVDASAGEEETVERWWSAAWAGVPKQVREEV